MTASRPAVSMLATGKVRKRKKKLAPGSQEGS